MYCTKCGRKLDENTGLCPNCDSFILSYVRPRGAPAQTAQTKQGGHDKQTVKIPAPAYDGAEPDVETGKKPGSKTLFIMLATVVPTLIICIFIYRLQFNIIRSEMRMNTPGNTSGNIVNMGLASQSDGWIYYTNIFDNFSLNKIRPDGTGKTMLSRAQTAEINVVGDWIYCISQDASADNYYLYKIKTDGTGKVKLSNDAILGSSASYSVAVRGGWIYYTNDSDGNFIYKIRTDGTGEKKLTSERTCFFNIYGGWIYCTSYNPDNSEYTLFKIRTDGTHKTVLVNEFAKFINVTDGWIYYINGSNQNLIYKIRTDGTDRQWVADIRMACFNISGDWMYYSDLGDNGSLYKMKLDGSGKIKLNSDNSVYINVVGDWIYYIDLGGSDSYLGDYQLQYKIRTDGTDRQRVG